MKSLFHMPGVVPGIRNRLVTAATIIAVTALILFSPSCRPSPQARNEEMEARKQQWTAEYKEAFPERTQDTTELKRRLDHFKETGNKVGQLMMYRVLGNEARNSSQFRAAIENHTAALEAAYAINDTINITVVMNDLATDFRRIGAFDEAAPYHYLALRIAEQYRGPDTLLNERNMASAYNGIGSICRAMNENDEAVRVYNKALELETKHDNFRGMAINYANIGAVHFDRGEYAEAEEYYAVSLEYNEKAKLPMGIALCRINIGRIHEVNGRTDEALDQYTQAYDVLAGTPDKWHWLDACFQVANMYTIKGDFRRAREYLDAGLRTALEIGSLKHLEKAYILFSEYNYGRGDFKRSIDDMRTSREYAETLQNNLEVDRLLESRVKYETEKFTGRIDELDRINREQTVRNRNTVLMTIPAIVALIALLSMLLWRNRLERRRAAELKNLERMRSNFFTNITHEFRTPITVINGLAGHRLSEMEDKDSPEAKDLGAVQRQGERMLHLVNQLLEFSRSEAGVNRPKWRHGDMAEYLQVITEPYKHYARNKGVELFVYSEAESLPMNFAPSSMRKVMGNLLSNAIRHCGAGDNIVIHITHDQHSGRCLIQVKDSGEGIAPENLPHIFELYYTSGDSMGSGIGLALSKQLVEEIGGTIAVSSTPGKGAEFTVSMPVSDAAIPEDDKEEPDEDDPGVPNGDLETSGLESDDDWDGLAAGAAGGKKTILIVEDNRDVARYYSAILSNKYSLIYASNGSEGLLMAEQYVPDLIITDVMMPEKDGYAFTVDLRASLAVSHIPVIMITAKGTTEDKLEGLKAGADAYLPKPFDESELLASIKQLLESRARLMKTYTDAILHGNGSEVTDLPADTAVNADHNLAFISKLFTAVNIHLDDEAYFPDGFADDMCLSVSQLYRKLKAMTGHTVSSFVMQARLDKAKQMLLKNGDNIKEIALACGFDNMSYFSRSFKTVFGYTPSEFLKIPESKNPKE